MGLKGKVCIVTGGGSGIGRGVAKKMASIGGKIIIVGRTASKIEAVRKEIEGAQGTALTFTLDVSDYDGVQKMALDVIRAFGRIDVLINNAGHSSHHRRVLTTTPEEIRNVIDSNLIGTIYCTQAVLPFMKQTDSGTIINVSSLAGVTASVMGGMIYSAAKAAVINFTEFLTNVELKDSAIRASVVIPGEVDTPVLDKRPIPPPKSARAEMVTIDDTAEVIVLIANLPVRTNIPRLIIKPTVQRDAAETSRFP